MIIVIDGLSGSGKSSTAKAVAEKLGIQYLDSGALYRVATYIWLKADKDTEKFLDILPLKDIQFEYVDKDFIIHVDGVNVSHEIRKQNVSEHVSIVAAMPDVRIFINTLMRKAVKDSNYIADGRDLGSAVFPDADLKFFMEASLEVRAERRFKELKQSDESVTLRQVMENLSDRDSRDKSRKMDPLVKPEDAYIIDTSAKTFDEQVNEICTIISEKVLINKNLEL
jgi:CMP/dCMP kinase